MLKFHHTLTNTHTLLYMMHRFLSSSKNEVGNGDSVFVSVRNLLRVVIQTAWGFHHCSNLFTFRYKMCKGHRSKINDVKMIINQLLAWSIVYYGHIVNVSNWLMVNKLFANVNEMSLSFWFVEYRYHYWLSITINGTCIPLKKVLRANIANTLTRL